MREYELVVIMSPVLSHEDIQESWNNITRYITDQGGEILREESWGMRRLAYPINKYNEGIYFFTHSRLTTEIAQELNAMLRVNENVIRQLLVRAEELPEKPVEPDVSAPTDSTEDAEKPVEPDVSAPTDSAEDAGPSPKQSSKKNGT